MTGNASRKATLVLAANLVGAALGYAALLVIGRYFAPAAYGSYLFALSATGLLALLSNLGIGTAHQRHVAQGVEPGRALGVFVRLRLAFGAALLLLFAGAYALWSATRGGGLTDATTPTVLGLALLVQVMSGSRQVLFDTWQGQQRVHRVETVRFVDTFLVVALLGNAALLLAHLQGRWEVVPGIGAFWADRLGLRSPLGPAESALLLAACYALPKALTLAMAWAWSLRDRLRLGPWDRGLARSYMGFALPMAAMGALALVLQYTDVLMLGFFWTAREVGLYGAAQKLSGVALLGGMAVGTVLFPRFAQLHAAGDAAREDATFYAAERYLLLLAAPVATLMVALPGQSLHIGVGDAYLGAAGPLRLLALWAFVTAMALPLGSRLMAAGRTGLLLRYSGLNAAVNVALNLWLIPPGRPGAGLGAGGAALATLLSTGLAYAYLRWHGRRIYGLPWVDAQQARILAAGALAGAFWAAAAHWAAPHWFDRVWELAAWGVLGGLVFAAGLAACGGLSRSDLRFLRRAAHPRELIAELRGH